MYSLQQKKTSHRQISISREKPFILQKNPTLYVAFYSFSKNLISITFLNSSPLICAPKVSFSKTSYVTFLTFSPVNLCSQGFHLARNKYGATNIAGIIRNSYLRDCVCNLERIYIVLLTNFFDEKNNFVNLLQIIC